MTEKQITIRSLDLKLAAGREQASIPTHTVRKMIIDGTIRRAPGMLCSSNTAKIVREPGGLPSVVCPQCGRSWS